MQVSPTNDGPQGPTRLRVLCVEDNYLLAESLRRRFAKEPEFEFVGALPAADGLVQEVERIRPDCILLDINMPGKDPLDALQELTDRHPDARVIVLSGYVRRDMVDKALAAGACGYVSKGEETGTVIDALRRAAVGEVVLSPEVQRFYSLPGRSA